MFKVGRIRIASLAMLVSAGLWLATTARAEDLSKRDLHVFLKGVATSILLHELGHLFIHQYALPTVGPEEDVADEFAVMHLIEMAKSGNERAHETVLHWADSNLILWELISADENAEPGEPTYLRDNANYWDAHSFQKKRAFNVLCLMFGAFPERYGFVLEQLGADEQTAQRCYEDYGKKLAAWSGLLWPTLRTSEDRIAGMTNGPPCYQTEGPRFVVEAEPPTQSQGRFYENRYLYLKLFDLLAFTLNEHFKLDPLGRTVAIRPQSCGEANAYYDPDTVEIIFCYEFLDLLANVYVPYITGLPYADWEAAPPPVPDWLVGRWMHDDDPTGQGLFGVRTTYDFAADGKFVKTSLFHSSTSPFETVVEGHYGWDVGTLWLLETKWDDGDCWSSSCISSGFDLLDYKIHYPNSGVYSLAGRDRSVPFVTEKVPDSPPQLIFFGAGYTDLYGNERDPDGYLKQ